VALSDTLTARRKQSAIEEIARVALEVCARDGFETTNVETIAAAAGCSPRTFYRYFGTKEDVLFHDLPAAIEHLRDVLDTHLADGLGPWDAVSEAVVEFISRFDADVNQRLVPTQRMHLWLTVPALRSRYMLYVSQTEQVITECLCAHRGTTPDDDDIAQLIAVTATGATRITMLTHTPHRRRQPLEKHLREALAIVGHGLADDVRQERPRRRATTRRTSAKPAA